MVTTSPHFTWEDARAIARVAHAGQTDKLEVDYMEHVEAVAAGLADFDPDVQVAGLLHDVVEDADLGLDHLRSSGGSRPPCFEGCRRPTAVDRLRGSARLT